MSSETFAALKSKVKECFNNGIASSSLAKNVDDGVEMEKALCAHVASELNARSLMRLCLDQRVIADDDPELMRSASNPEELQFVTALEPKATGLNINFRKHELVFARGSRMQSTFQRISTDRYAAVLAEMANPVRNDQRLEGWADEFIDSLLELEDDTLREYLAVAAFYGSTTTHGYGLNVEKAQAYLEDYSYEKQQIYLAPTPTLNSEVVTELAKIMVHRQVQLRGLVMSATTCRDAEWYPNNTTKPWFHQTSDREEGVAGTFKGYTVILSKNVPPGHVYGVTDKSALGKMISLKGAAEHGLQSHHLPSSSTYMAGVVDTYVSETVSAMITDLRGIAIAVLRKAAPLCIDWVDRDKRDRAVMINSRS